MQQQQIKKRPRKRSTAQDDAYAQADEAVAEGVDRRKKLSGATDEVLAKVSQALEGTS